MSTAWKWFRYLSGFIVNIAAIALACSSTWLSAWYPDEQLRIQGAASIKPDFWSVILRWENLAPTNPVPYTGLFILLNIGLVIPSLRSSFRLAELEEKEAAFKAEQIAHAETQRRYYHAVEANLGYIISQKIQQFDEGCRISVYRYDAIRRVFRLVFRFCHKSELKGSGRIAIPIEGVLAALWKGGNSICIDELPDPGDRTQIPLMRYATQMNLKLRPYGVSIPQETISELRMLSRSYFGYALTDPENDNKYALLLVESTDPKKFNETTMLADIERVNLKITNNVNTLISLDAILNPYGASENV